ncbi:MAG: TRAP transporter substrate-binding protein DctP, partial [Pseudomonadota bacterium]
MATRWITSTIGAFAALALWANVAAAQTWIMASGYPEDNFHTKNIRLFIEDIAANSDLEIELQSNDTLIKLDAIRTAVQRGQVPIGEIRLGVYGNEDPMFILAGLPFIASTYAEAWLLKDLQREYFNAKFAEIGLRVLYYSPWPGQGFYTQSAVGGLGDFDGKKLRIYSTATQKMGELLGFQATILPFAEIPQAFSTGLIEALFTSPQTGIDVQAWDNTSHFTYAGAIFSKNAVVVSEAMFQAL